MCLFWTVRSHPLGKRLVQLLLVTLVSVSCVEKCRKLENILINMMVHILIYKCKYSGVLQENNNYKIKITSYEWESVSAALNRHIIYTSIYTESNNGNGGIAQWQSIRLQIERSPVQLRLPPCKFFISRSWRNNFLFHDLGGIINKNLLNHSNS